MSTRNETLEGLAWVLVVLLSMASLFACVLISVAVVLDMVLAVFRAL